MVLFFTTFLMDYGANGVSRRICRSFSLRRPIGLDRGRGRGRRLLLRLRRGGWRGLNGRRCCWIKLKRAIRTGTHGESGLHVFSSDWSFSGYDGGQLLNPHSALVSIV